MGLGDLMGILNQYRNAPGLLVSGGLSSLSGLS
jgi:hypothetical protein